LALEFIVTELIASEKEFAMTRSMTRRTIVAAALASPLVATGTSARAQGLLPPAPPLPDYAPVPQSALGPALNAHGYYVGRVERNLDWVTDGVYQAAFLTTRDGVVLLDAPPTIGHNLQRAVHEIAAANGVSNKVTHLIYSHHHADHGGASSLFDKNVVRIGHEETRRLLLRDNDPARPPPEETFSDKRTQNIGGERIELAWHGSNHSPDNMPDHDTLMLIDVFNVGWAPRSTRCGRAMRSSRSSMRSAARPSKRTALASSALCKLVHSPSAGSRLPASCSGTGLASRPCRPLFRSR
jgi:Metallo-beta-lactamase superfamily